jgi:hypothetical protein
VKKRLKTNVKIGLKIDVKSWLKFVVKNQLKTVAIAFRVSSGIYAPMY